MVDPDMINLITNLACGAPSDQERQWLSARFRQMVNNQPQAILDALFFNCYQETPSLSRFSQLRHFLVPHASYIYPGVASYAKHLQSSPVTSEDCIRQVLILREARFLCREIVTLVLSDAVIPFTRRKVLHQSLQWLKVVPESLANSHIDQDEVLANIHRYLSRSDLLAELPQFQAIYFTGDELSHLSGLQIYRSTPDLESQLERVLIPLRKRDILKVLQQFIQTCPLPLHTKQAFAVYISLGEVIPWHRHSFIKRLLAVSFQEAKVYACLQK